VFVCCLVRGLTVALVLSAVFALSTLIALGT
jgi:hypothetical protein